MQSIEVDPGEKAVIILQSLICYLREKNVLNRADIEELRDRVEARISEVGRTMPCDISAASAAAREMADLEQFCGDRYGQTPKTDEKPVYTPPLHASIFHTLDVPESVRLRSRNQSERYWPGYRPAPAATP